MLLMASCPARVVRHRNEALARRRRRAAASASSEVAAGEALVAWARSDGAYVSPKLAVNATTDDGLRGVVAREHVEQDELLIALPPCCSIFSSAAAACETHAGLAQALSVCPLEEEGALALWLALAFDSAACALSAYAAALPAEPPALPALWPAAARTLLPWWLQEEAERSAASFGATLERMAEAAQLLQGAAPSRQRLAWALAHVRARAVRVQASTSCKALMQVVDTMNHDFCADGAVAQARFEGGGVRFVARRAAAAGEQVTWTYGELSSDQLLLQYGFVPNDALHPHARLSLSLPAHLFRESLARAAAGLGAGGSERLRRLAGACGLGPEGGEDEDVLFIVTPREAPRALLALCGAATLREAEAASYFDGDETVSDEGHARRARALAASLLAQAADEWVGEDAGEEPEEHAEAVAAGDALTASARALLRSAAHAAAAQCPIVPVLRAPESD